MGEAADNGLGAKARTRCEMQGITEVIQKSCKDPGLQLDMAFLKPSQLINSDPDSCCHSPTLINN